MNEKIDFIEIRPSVQSLTKSEIISHIKNESKIESTFQFQNNSKSIMDLARLTLENNLIQQNTLLHSWTVLSINDVKQSFVVKLFPNRSCTCLKKDCIHIIAVRMSIGDFDENEKSEMNLYDLQKSNSKLKHSKSGKKSFRDFKQINTGKVEKKIMDKNSDNKFGEKYGELTDSATDIVSDSDDYIIPDDGKIECKSNSSINDTKFSDEEILDFSECIDYTESYKISPEKIENLIVDKNMLLKMSETEDLYPKLEEYLNEWETFPIQVHRKFTGEFISLDKNKQLSSFIVEDGLKSQIVKNEFENIITVMRSECLMFIFSDEKMKLMK